jgi:predicted nucleic acid-binding protein
MSADRAFIDTNVFIYYQRSDDITKHKISKATISFFDCVVSTQVLNEICNLLTRKYPTLFSDIKKYILDIIASSDLVIITHPLIQKALELCENFSISYYDALMVVAALEANCTYLISEDMQDGLIIENKLQIVNIYEHADILMPVL